MTSPNTRVHLVSSAPLTPTYEHQMDFTDAATQFSYFDGKVSHRFNDDFTYQREENSIKVPAEYDTLYDCNYLMYQNTNFGNKWFYAFITKKEYINPNTTRIYFELDVYQTWQFDIIFKDSFVEREHSDRWNSDGTPIINTVEEDLNYGTEYNIKSVTKYVPFTDIYFLVIVAKNRIDGSTNQISSTLNGAPQPLTYYVHPFRMDDTVPIVDIDGSAVSIDRVLDVLNTIYLMSNAANNIVSLYVTNYFGLPSNDPNVLSFGSSNITHVTITDGTNTVNTLHVEDISTYQPLTATIGQKYDGFDSVTESKLQMSPYCMIELTDFRGNTISLKPQYIYDTNLILKVKGSLGTDNKVVYQIDEYNTQTLDATNSDIVALQSALIDNNPNDVPIMSDYLAAYLQGNRNTLKNDANAAIFHAVANTAGSILGGVGSAASGNPVGVVDAATGAATGVASSYFQLKGIQAKIKDISNIPPSLTKMGSNTAFDYGNGYNGVYIVKKQITPEYQKKLTDYFNMFGYKINEVKQPNLKTRQYWNYVKTIGAIILGDVPQDHLIKIKQMFDNGVTLWHSDNVGDYSLVNNEV